MKKRRLFVFNAVFAAMAALAAVAACSSPTGSTTPNPDPGTKPVITITTQPRADNTFTVGGISGSLSVAAAVTEGAALSYQWYSNTTASNVGGTSLGATAKTKDFTIPATLSEGTYYYFCEVTASGGATPKRSSVAKVTVSPVSQAPAIIITTQPLGTTQVMEGYISGSLFVAASGSGGAEVTGYQWYRDASGDYDGAELISGATTASFTIPANLAAGTYYYFCEITASNVGEPAHSQIAVVTVKAPVPEISITAQPKATTTVTVGKIAESLSVTAAGIGGAEITGYQWYSNTYDNTWGGSVIDGATTASLTIPDNLAVGDYYYYCMITASRVTALYTAVAKVTVASAITITTQPENITVGAGNITENLSVTATVAEGVSISGYQWYETYYDGNDYGTPVSGATSASFAIPTDLTIGDHYYFCEITASGGTDIVRSNAAKVTVHNVITITTGPAANTSVKAGDISESLSVTATVTGSDTLRYQWYQNTTASNEGGEEIEGATLASFTIPIGLLKGDCYYYCELTASSGWALPVRSNIATVTVSDPDTDFVIKLDEDPELISQTAEALSGIGKLFSVEGSGWVTRKWYVNGTAMAETADYMFSQFAGVYNLTVVVSDASGDTYSGTCWVTVR